MFLIHLLKVVNELNQLQCIINLFPYGNGAFELIDGEINCLQRFFSVGGTDSNHYARLSNRTIPNNMLNTYFVDIPPVPNLSSHYFLLISSIQIIKPYRILFSFQTEPYRYMPRIQEKQPSYLPDCYKYEERI